MNYEYKPEDANDYLKWLEDEELKSEPTVEEIVALEMKRKFDAAKEIRFDEYKDKFVRAITQEGSSYVYNPISVIASGVLFAICKEGTGKVVFRLIKASLVTSHENWQTNSELNEFYIQTAAQVSGTNPRKFEVDGMYSCVATFGSFVERGYLATHTVCAPEDKKQYYQESLMDPEYTVELAVPIGDKLTKVCIDRRLYIEPEQITQLEVV